MGNLGNKVLNVYDLIKVNLLVIFSGLAMKFSLFMRGVKTGSGLKFFGLAKVKRGSNSKITIGNKCSFRSTPTSNLIGINRPCIISSIGSKSELTMGDNCGLSGTVIGCFEKISLGNNVRCGANTLITDSDWHLDDPRVGKPKPIIIDNNVWLGVDVTVLKGAKIGENTIIGAGSVVVGEIPANVIAGGNPCKVLKSLEK